MKKILLFAVVFSVLLVSCAPGIIPHEGGYTVTLMNGEEKFLDYPFCETYSNANLYAETKTLFVRCSNLKLETMFVAQITSFVVNE